MNCDVKLAYERPTTSVRKLEMENPITAGSIPGTTIMMSHSNDDVIVTDFTKDNAFGTDGMWDASF